MDYNKYLDLRIKICKAKLRICKPSEFVSDIHSKMLKAEIEILINEKESL